MKLLDTGLTTGVHYTFIGYEGQVSDARRGSLGEHRSDHPGHIYSYRRYSRKIGRKESPACTDAYNS